MRRHRSTGTIKPAAIRLTSGLPRLVQGPWRSHGLAQAFLNWSAVNLTARREDCRKFELNPPAAYVGGAFLRPGRPMPFTNTISIDQRGEVVRCSHCRAKTELFVSMANPKDGRILCIFRCQCGKLTSTDNRAPEWGRGASVPRFG